MPSSPQRSSGRALLSFTLLAGLLVGLAPACARSTVEDEAGVAPELAPVREDTSGGIEKRHQEPVASLIERSSAGIRVSTRPDGTLIVRIRGAASFRGNEEPLYVIDGVALPSGMGGRLAGISPHDIESIKVLKGPPETVLYGVRGGNGVILITTRRP